MSVTLLSLVRRVIFSRINNLIHSVDLSSKIIEGFGVIWKCLPGFSARVLTHAPFVKMTIGSHSGKPLQYSHSGSCTKLISVSEHMYLILKVGASSARKDALY